MTAPRTLAPLVLTTIDLPRPGVAEDAPPLALLRGGIALLGVFDGLGGAGVRAVDGEDGRRSSAYYAARTASGAAAAQFAQASAAEGASFATAVAAAIGRSLAQRHRIAPPRIGTLRSALLRSYPTTAALLRVSPCPGGLDLLALWAGDSRCYVLTPQAGLQQLSLDDSHAAADPMGALRDDSCMTHLLCAEHPAHLRTSARRLVAGPAVLFATSDGAYAALPSPMHFEALLLDTVLEARDPATWAATLAAHLVPLADDDISLAAAFAGGSFEGFAARRAQLTHLLEQPLDAAWECYRPGYMALAGPA